MTTTNNLNLNEGIEQQQTVAEFSIKVTSASTPDEFKDMVDEFSPTTGKLVLENDIAQIAVVKVSDIWMSNADWIDEKKKNKVQLLRINLPNQQYEEEVNEVDEFIDRLKSLDLGDELLWKIAGTMSTADAKLFTSNLIDAVEQIEEREKLNGK